ATLDVDRIVPGHGPISGKKDIAEMKNYLIAFDEKARELSTKSSDVAAVAAEMKKTLPARAQADWMIPNNLQLKYMKGK
ncbi:MAG TPA: MBL fold metallo-hydrolase, partial [Geobacteraceae bacterium]|nr:MBL fold metallo-hydrolase [Geobacteraceae bacterium]